MIADADGEGGGEIETEEESQIDRARGEPQAEQPAGVQADDEKALRPLNTRQRRKRLFDDEGIRLFFEQESYL